MWAGTFIVVGEGIARVVATGSRTRLGSIAQLTSSAQRPPGPLAVELRRIVRIMAVLTVSVGVAFFVLTRFTGTPARDGFLFAVGVTVALVPEGLLPTLTLSLAMGAQRMAGKQALVRHLQAVETLGSTTFVCTDKTGTLTRNEMEVRHVWTPAGSVEIDGDGYGPEARVDGRPDSITAAALAARTARTTSQGRAVRRDDRWQPVGDPMEAAIDALCRRLGQDDVEPRVDRRFAFDPRRRRASAVVGTAVLVKGLPDAVLPRCVAASAGAAAEVDRLASKGLRVLAVARGSATVLTPTSTADDVERDLELLALLGLQDPPRDHVPAALAACRRAGVKVAMVTGDHPSTAAAIAREVGLADGEVVVVSGDELPDDDDALGTLLDRDGVVISLPRPSTSCASPVRCRHRSRRRDDG